MRNLIPRLFAPLLLALMSAGAAMGSDLDVHLFDYCFPPVSCDLQLYINGFGSPAAGNATFGGTPWSFQFVTADPESWHWNPMQDHSDATFGEGGIFQMTGPDNLTFTGEIVDGSVNFNFDSEVGQFDFTGKWSNNVEGYGDVLIGGGGGVLAATLDAYAVPEPTSLTLLTSGIVGVSSLCRKRFRV